MKLDQFGIANFKCFSHPVFIGQRPITINIGPNNSGKSSLLKAIMLLKKSLVGDEQFKSGKILEEINSNFYRSLGRPADYLNSKEQNLEYTISVPEENKVKVLRNDNIKITLSFAFNQDVKTSIKKSENGKSNKFMFDKGAEGIATLVKYSIHLNGFEVITLSRDFKINKLSNGDLGYHGSITIMTGAFNRSENFNKDKFEVDFPDDSFYHIEELVKAIKKGLINLPRVTTTKILELISLSLESVLDFQFYLEDCKLIDLNRREFKRSFDIDQSRTFNEFINYYYETNRNNIRVTKDLLEQILPIFNLSSKVEITEPYDDRFEIFLRLADKSKRNLVDFGSGINQLLPLLLAASSSINADKSPLLLVEEPESNLHPNFQAKLADMFMILHKQRSLDFFIETHSEYLVRRFQVLVAKGLIKPDDIIINYFWVENDVNKCKQIEFKPNGSLSDSFNPGFYDEADRIAYDLFLLRHFQNN